MSIQCVVFDLDDTLYLEKDYVRSGFRAVGKWWEHLTGENDFFELAYGCFNRGVRGKIFNEVLSLYGMFSDPEIINKMVAIYRNHEPNIKLLPDAEACLRRLRPLMKLAIITDGSAEARRAKIKALGLKQRMDSIIITSEYGVGFEKPHPKAFRETMERTGSKPEQCIYIADNPKKDFKAPLSMNWRVVRIKRSEGLYSETPLHKEESHISSILSLDKVVNFFII